MSWWSSLFSAGNTVEKIADGVISAGDKMWYTEEEKAEMKMEYTKFLPTLLKSYEPFRIAQRILAFWFAFLFGISFIIGLVIYVFNAMIKYKDMRQGVDPDKIVLVDIKPLLDLNVAFEMPIIMGLILTWYFGGGLISSFKKDR